MACPASPGGSSVVASAVQPKRGYSSVISITYAHNRDPNVDADQQVEQALGYFPEKASITAATNAGMMKSFDPNLGYHAFTATPPTAPSECM